MTEIILFKIRDKETGLYSKGGMYPMWSKTGKVWKRQGHLSSHFSQLSANARDFYKNAEVIKIVVTEAEIESIPVSEYVLAAKERADAREAKQQLLIEKWRVKNAQREIERLQKIVNSGGK